MPKVVKDKNARRGVAYKERHAPLGQVLQDDENRGKYAQMKNRNNNNHATEDYKGEKKQKNRNFLGKKYNSNREDDDYNNTTMNEDEDGLLDEKMSRRILALSREQQIELEVEERTEMAKKTAERKNMKTRKELRMQRGDENIFDDENSELEEDDENSVDDVENVEEDWVEHDGGYVKVVDGAHGLTAEEEAVVAAMMGGGNGAEGRRTLADIILAKIHEKETKGQQELEGEDEGIQPSLPPKVIQVYTDIGKILSRYTAGKLPKAFKIIPSLSNWEEVLYLTRPDQWTPQAMFAATRIFASNLNPKMAQRFYNLILLDSVRADIVANHKLNYHYYMSLKKAVYKPAAFFKGILLPLCKENCTLREAAIVASVLQRVSIPVHHSAVAIHKLAQMDSYNGASSIFIRTLLNKKYSLPAPVIGSLVRHFASFAHDPKTTLPVLWHQCLLTFVQRYRSEVQDEAREALRLVMKVHFHPKITLEIRRELFGAQAWKEEREQVSTMEEE